MNIKDYTINIKPNKKVITEFIKQHHYSQTCPIAISYCFSLEHKGQLIGACVFSSPSRQVGAVSGYSKLIELSRLYIIDETPKNTESYFIGYCLRWLKSNTELEAVLSFADPTEGHE